MCGFVGIVYNDRRRAVDRDTLARAAAQLVHRGPDDEGFYLDGNVGLAHRRLSIIDLSPKGRQPLGNEDGRIQIAFNGEIYNFQSLRKDLERRGHRFRSDTDTEVIVHLYEELGPECVKELRGMFGFALWDARKEMLFLARDRLGKKPVKYVLLPDGIAFASELKALLELPGVQAIVDPSMMPEYLWSLYLPSPRTGLKGIHKLPAAHTLVWRNGTPQVKRYWRLHYQPKHTEDIQACREEFVRIFDESVALRMISDVPLGAFLSGGVDSSAVVASMSLQSNRPVETFSIGFEEERFNELPLARQIVERYQTEHHELIVQPDAAELLPRLAEIYEEPYADSSALPSYYVAEMARRDVTVALNGDGGDENFAGYNRYSAFLLRMRKRDWLRRCGVGGLLRKINSSAWTRRLLKGKIRSAAELMVGSVEDQYVRHGAIFPLELQQRLFRPEVWDKLGWTPGSHPLHAAFSAAAGGVELLDRLLLGDIETYLADDLLVKMDLATMTHGLEARAPLLDHELMEFTARLPTEWKYDPKGRYSRFGAVKKAFFRDAVAARLPEDLLNAGKRGFSIPVDHWFRDELYGLARDLLVSPTTQILEYFRPQVLEQLIGEHHSGRADHGTRLWGLVTLELWHRWVRGKS